MLKMRRWLALATLLLAFAVALGWWEYSRWAALRDRVAGTYTGAALGNSAKVVVFRLSPDGSSRWDHYPPGAVQPRVTVHGRWRLSGRVLIMEDGVAATTPVGLASLLERFDRPLMGSPVSKYRVISADDSGIVLDIGGGATWVLSRQADEP